MRKVKCMVTGETGYNYEFYKAPNGKYYKTKEIYDHMISQRDYRGKIIQLINSKILNKNIGNCSSLIGKLINETGLECETIYNSILEKIEYIKDVLKDSNESDASKIYLIFKIATNSYKKITYAGCYEIRNNKTNEVYIGESINLFRRFTEHIEELYENRHHCNKLQEAFNKTKSISNFTITPLFMIPIVAIDKNELKQETLYLESAFYLIYRKNKEKLYNTKNPYVALKEENVTLSGYEIDCKEVLRMIVKDKYNVISKDLLEQIKENLKDIIKDDELIADSNTPIPDKVITENNNNPKRKSWEGFTEIKGLSIDYIMSQIQRTKGLLCNGTNLFRISNVLKDFSERGILPQDYDYQKIRQIMESNNLIYIDDSGRTVATTYVLENDLYLISDIKDKKNPYFYYYVTDKCIELLSDIFGKIQNDDLKKIA